LPGLPTGSYFVRASAPSAAGLIDELFDNISCPCTITTGSPVVVTAPATTGNINFALTPALAQGITTRVSVGTGGGQGNDPSYMPALSADSRFVAFDSTASNLIGGDTNGAGDVFVHDRLTGTTSRISVATGGAQGNNLSTSPALSADGRVVAFHSYANNFVTGDSNGESDVFVHDRLTATTTRVSVATGGTEGNGGSYEPALSADGRFVAFSSRASNLVTGDTNSSWDAFVHDRLTGTTTRVSIATSGAQVNHSYCDIGCAPLRPAISADGRVVAFHSHANNLVTGDTNDASDVFVHDRLTTTTTRVSVATGGPQGNGDSYDVTVSADGRFVAFDSWASNLAAGDTNDMWDAFVHDRQTGTTTRLTVATGGAQVNNHTCNDFQCDAFATISADGRFVAFDSGANNLVTGDTNGATDVFVHDRLTTTTTRVSVTTGGLQGNGASYYVTVGADGRFVAFSSLANNFVAGDTNGAADVFVHDRGVSGPATVLLVSANVQNAQPIGTPITWTAYAAGGSATLEYRFWLLNQTTATWSELRGYAPSNAVVWTPNVAGSYVVQVWVRSTGSTASYDSLRNSEPFAVQPSIINVNNSLVIDVFNVDDIERVKVNGRTVGQLGYGQTGSVDVMPWLNPGLNVVEIELENLLGGWTYGFRLRGDGVVLAIEECGDAGSLGCLDDDHTLGIVYRRAFLVRRGAQMTLDRTSLRFGAVTTGAAFVSQTAAQVVRLTQSGAGTVMWTATSSQPWLQVSPASGTGSTNLSVSVVSVGGLPVGGSVTGAITLSMTGASNTPGPITGLAEPHPERDLGESVRLRGHTREQHDGGDGGDPVHGLGARRRRGNAGDGLPGGARGGGGARRSELRGGGTDFRWLCGVHRRGAARCAGRVSDLPAQHQGGVGVYGADQHAAQPGERHVRVLYACAGPRRAHDAAGDADDDVRQRERHETVRGD